MGEDQLVYLVKLVKPEKGVLLGSLVWLVKQVLLDPQGHQDLEVFQVPQACRVHLVHLVVEDQMVKEDPQEKQESVEQMVKLDCLA